MPLFDLVILALIQGLTEFLPISSSGHLILLPTLMGSADQGLALDVAVHVGSLLAVVLYFWHDVWRATRGFGQVLRGNISNADGFLALCLIVATVPVVIAGFILKITGLNEALRSVEVIGWTMLVFGLFLYWADKTKPEVKHADGWLLKDALIMGLWQVIALIPGTSRAGITITGARLLGYERHDAAKLAMLMSIPTIIASGALLGLDVVGEADWALLKDAGIAAAFAFFAALGALALMMRLLASVSFTPYVIYRVILGIGLLIYAYS
ncbi:undecaprenyl-diphosphatase [Rubricella aquisinus]|uniref:Undecaprenyl-diphosphatase n=1 Tax=Rubricella aquisinus TaxID=2028108 RepID=A0A840WVW2_9RHOB|nr:undecaprenyl-diphosphate phosphatase [Rubricella aquisinus]MBB5514384.1 undecaprenyl-diphosphatase [Rubricella aquisinus]